MATISHPQQAQTLKTSTGATYSYISIPPSKPTNPTLLLLHGFPSSSYDWRHQIAHFSAAPLQWGIIAPDLLGYGASDRPLNAAAYRGDKMAREIFDILAAEGYGEERRVHAVAHDWGSFLPSRLCNWFPDVCATATFLTVGYRPPGMDLDVDAVNSLTRNVIGFEVLGYWKFFEREDAGQIIEDHFDSFYSLVYAADPRDWKEHLAPLGALEAWLKDDKVSKVGDFVSAEDKLTTRQILAPSFTPALNWYRASIQNLHTAAEQSAISASPPATSTTPNLPILFIESALDPISSGPNTRRVMSECIPDCRVGVLQAGHWVMLECADRVNELLEEFTVGRSTDRG